MTTYNLAIIVLIAAVALFITSRIARRAKTVNPQLMAAVNALRVVVLVLGGFLFLQKVRRMSHAITCHLPTATVLLIVSLFGVRQIYPNREFSTQEIAVISTVVLALSLSITGALHV